MSTPEVPVSKAMLLNAIHWFRPHFNQTVVTGIESQFPNQPFAKEIQVVLDAAEIISQQFQALRGDLPLDQLLAKLSGKDAGLLPLFKRMILMYRRDRAAYTERLVEKTFHLDLARTLEQEVKALDDLTGAESFSLIADLRLPRLKDFLPFQYIESLGLNQLPLLGRQYDEKFHMLQAPGLFLPDLAYFRAKCEERETPLAIGFVDIDDFKSVNTRHTETKVDRNLLPRFMQAIEAHVFHHGYAYRQGGEEYLLLVPSLSRALSIAFLEELRVKLANLSYPDIPEKTTVSIGLCIVEPDSPLTDRELLHRANRAKQFAKGNGKNCIATYGGSRLADADLEVIAASHS